MANTKKSIFVTASADFSAATNLLGDGSQLTDADLGITYDAGNGDIIVMPDGTTEDLYVGATPQEITVVPAGITGNDTVFSDGRTMHVTIVEVSGGRAVFPRRTFSGETLDELVTAIGGAELEIGDGKALTCALDNPTPASATGIVITAAEDVILKVAVNEEMEVTITENSFALHKGYTQAEAIAFAKDVATHQYGRTNRVGFPIVEPDFGAQLTNATYSLVTFVKQTTRFDKNFGAGYIDQEYIYVLHPTTSAFAWTEPTP